LPWLKSHSEIEVVSRDRASAYADAVKRALPHGTQVADRYHLVQNLREHLQQFLDRKRTWLPEMEDNPLKAASTDDRGLTSARETQTSRTSPSTTSASSSDQPEGPVQPALSKELGQEVELASLTYAERKKKISRDKRYARYEQVLALHQAGMGQRAIARQMHMSRRIVRRYLSAETFPERAAGSGYNGPRKLDREIR
jgi:transposase